MINSGKIPCIPKIGVIAIVVGVVIIAISGWIAFCGWQWDWGPFSSLHALKVKGLPGNATKYDPMNVKPLNSSPLKNKRIVFLGSSVTKGAGACGVSFADYIAKKDSCTVSKEAVSGTTLANSEIDAHNSYIQRMLKISKSIKINLFVCQLSTRACLKKKRCTNMV